MDLLAAHGGPAESGLDLGKGLGAYPMHRARRGPTKRTKPFDASETRAVEERLPIQRRSPVSLIQALQEKMAEPPSADDQVRHARLEHIAVLMTELDHRGFDVEPLGKLLCVDAVMGGVLLVHFIPRFLEAAELGADFPEEIKLPSLEPSVAAGWARLLESADGEIHLETALSRLPRLHVTLESQTLDELVKWQPPATLQDGPPELVGDPCARWVLDRFTSTYLHTWAISSLEQEWRYVNGDRIAPCDSKQMTYRRIDRAEISNELARRRFEEPSPPDIPAIRTSDTYVGPAIEMCQAGRRSSAASIFEAMRAVNRLDDKAHNNYGFCLVPDQPEVGLDALEVAARMGMRRNPMNVGNRMYALAKLGRIATALEAAGELWNDLSPNSVAVSCFMWRYNTWDADEPTIEAVDDVVRYVLEFASHLALGAGDQDAAETWQARAAVRSVPGS